MTTTMHDRFASPDTVTAHFARRGRGAEFEMEAAWVASHLGGDFCRVLDVGCGNGVLFDSIGQHRVFGVDANLDGLLSSRLGGSSRVVCADGLALPFADSAFDAIVTQHVIEHIDDQASALREWRRVLSKRGRLLLLTPNAAFVDQSVFDDPTHTRLLQPDELAGLAERSGLRVVEIATLGLPWFRQTGTSPGLWRARRFVIRQARGMARVPGLRWRGQTLCLAATRDA